MRSLHAFDRSLGSQCVCSPPTVAVNAADQPKLNVLFLFADDMRADAIAAYGHPYIKTPNIDALVSAGFSFRGNYVFGGNNGAVCVPRS
jgi:Sulfatase